MQIRLNKEVKNNIKSNPAMHLAYSAFRNINTQQISKLCQSSCREVKHRHIGYLAACKKHQQTIADIQQYLPGWEPPFPAGSLQ